MPGEDYPTAEKVTQREYRLPIKFREDYGGEHREWIKEYVLPDWLVNDIAQEAERTAMERALEAVERLRSFNFGGEDHNHSINEALAAIRALIATESTEKANG